MENIPDMPFGKTSPELSVHTREKILEQSSKNLSKLKTVQPLFLDLRTGNGKQRELSWQTITPSLGEFSMLNFGEYPNAVDASSLWQILEDNVQQKYYLSETACRGVLRRAAKRGTEMPPILIAVLQKQGKLTDEELIQMGLTPPPILLDNHPNDSRVTVSNEKCVQTLTSRMGTGGGNAPMLLQAIGYDRYNQAITGDKSQTLKAYNGSDDIPAVILNDQGGSCIRVEHGNISPTLRAQDHGHPPCVMDENPKECYTLITGGFVTLDKDKAQTLTARDYKFPQSVCYSGDIAGTLDAHYYLGCGARGGKEREFVAQQTSEYNWVIRRLTPKECCRLQGMPDWWVDGIEHKDAPEYKMWGNGMALPCVLYVMEGIAKANKKDLLNYIGGTS